MQKSPSKPRQTLAPARRLAEGALSSLAVTVPFTLDELRRRLDSRCPTTLNASQRASVAIILGQVDGSLLVLFIRRAEHPQDPWSGHMAFPGGRRDQQDVDDLATARRETLEEVGLDLEAQATLLGRLDDIGASALGRPLDMVISPFVFSVETVSPIVPTAEVVESFWIPVAPLFHGQLSTARDFDLPGGRRTLPAWNVAGNVVWGLTYRMMDNLLALMRLSQPGSDPCP